MNLRSDWIVAGKYFLCLKYLLVMLCNDHLNIQYIIDLWGTHPDARLFYGTSDVILYFLIWYMGHICVVHGSYLCGTWVIFVWYMGHICVVHGSYLCGTWVIFVWYVGHICVVHGSYLCH